MSYVPAKKNTAYIFYCGLVSRSTGQFQSNPTIAAGDFKVSIDGGTLNNLATLPAVTPASSKMVKFSLSAAEMNGDNITIVGSDAAGAEWDDVIVNIQTSVRQIDDLATPTNITAGTITTVTNVTNAVKISAGTGAGQLDFTSGVVKANMTQIDGAATNGNNATLNLKRLDIQNDSAFQALRIMNTVGGAVYAQSPADCVSFLSTDGIGLNLHSNAEWGMAIGSDGNGLAAVEIIGGPLGNAVEIYADPAGGGNGNAIELGAAGTGKSISAPSGILGSDSEDLSVTNITDKVWDEATAGHSTAGTTGKALTDAGSAGDPWGTALPGLYAPGTAGDIIGNNLDAKVSDVKSKTDQLTFTNPGEVDANVQAVNDTELTGDGSGTPWGPV